MSQSSGDSAQSSTDTNAQRLSGVDQQIPGARRGPAPLSTDLTSSAKVYEQRPPRWRIAGPSTSDVAGAAGVFKAGSYFVWPDGAEPDLNSMTVMVFPSDPAGDYVEVQDQ